VTGKKQERKMKGKKPPKPDEKQKLWLITDKGRKYIETPPLPSATPPAEESARPLRPSSQTDTVSFPFPFLSLSFHLSLPTTTLKQRR